MVTHGQFPPDARIEKEMSSLINAGYHVYIYANERMTRHKVGKYDGAKVRYFNFSFSPVFLLFTLPIILKKMFRTDGINIIHMQDTPLVIPTSIATFFLKIPMIYDIHELWHMMVSNDEGISPAIKNTLKIWCKASEFIGTTIAKVILVTSNEIAFYIANTYFVQPYRIHVIKNLSPRLNKNDILKVNLSKDIFKICYVGNMDSGSDLLLDEVIKSATYLTKRMNYRFYLVGDGVLKPMLEKLAKQLRIDNYIEFTGYLPRKKAYGYIYASNVCLLPFKKNPNSDYASPHKLFEYMSFGKPVVSTPLMSTMRMVGEAIYLWEPPTAKRLSEILYELYRNGNLRKKLGKMGQKLVKERYNWEIEEKRFLKIYLRLAKKYIQADNVNKIFL